MRECVTPAGGFLIRWKRGVKAEFLGAKQDGASFAPGGFQPGPTRAVAQSAGVGKQDTYRSTCARGGPAPRPVLPSTAVSRVP